MNTGEKSLSPEEILRFQTKIYAYYREHARDLPWRRTNNAYHIFVSEIMLQQTQVGRVIEKYGEFIHAFPNFSILADSSLSDVLIVWQGLGYNRRAFSLLRAARLITSRYGGDLPQTVEGLSLLPGVGKATASAVLVFAFGKSVPFIETNIRRVFIDHFFQGKEGVRDQDILTLVEQALDRADPRNWYYALMDYGSMMGKTALSPNPNRKSLHYRKQAPFRDSDRRIRGAVLRMLLKDPLLPASEITTRSGVDSERVAHILGCLEKEGLVREEGGMYQIS